MYVLRGLIICKQSLACKAKLNKPHFWPFFCDCANDRLLDSNTMKLLNQIWPIRPHGRLAILPGADQFFARKCS